MAGRPEEQQPAHLFYDKDEAAKYTQNTRMIKIQKQMAQRCYELLNFPSNVSSMLLLDIGCGSGLSGEILQKKSNGKHNWVGCDLSMDMLQQAADRGLNGDLIRSDMGEGLPFRPGMFDGVISVSAIQWLCVAYTSRQNPYTRLKKFFTSLYQCIRQGGRAAMQFYPKDDKQVMLIRDAATKAGFGGGVVVDFPNSKKARKFYLVLWAGVAPGAYQMPEGKKEGDMEADISDSDEEGEEEEGEEGEAEGEGEDSDGDMEMSDGDGGEDGDEGSDEGLGEDAPRVDPFAPLACINNKRKVRLTERQKKGGKKRDGKKMVLNRKEYVKWRKLRRRVKGEKTAADSKYSARKRHTRW